MITIRKINKGSKIKSLEFYDKLQHEAEQRQRKKSNKKPHRSKLFREFGNKLWQERLPVKAKKKKKYHFLYS